MKKEILYIILTPPPNPKSAGITYFNNLGGYLRSIGKKAINIFHIEPSQNVFIWDSNEVPAHNHWTQPWQGSWVPWSEEAITRTFSDFSLILIHGENKHYKFFQNMNVVRYYLAGIGQLQKKGVPREGEYKLAWDAMYCENPDSILRKSTFRGDLSVAEALPVGNRDFDLTYIGKGHLWYPSTPRLDHTIELTRTWPANDDEYFYLLSKTRFLFTYDHITSVVEDAVIFGAYPIFLRHELKMMMCGWTRLIKICGTVIRLLGILWIII